MKIALLALATVLCSQTVFANSEDNVVDPIPLPAGERALDDLKEIHLTENAQLTTYVESDNLEGKSSVYGMGQPSQVSCSLMANEVSMSNFKATRRESVGGTDGFRFYIAPKKSITLSYKIDSVGVEAYKKSCNGEPELCDPNTYYQYRTEVKTTDKSGNEWVLSCIAPFSRELYVSDVKINGIVIK